MELHLDEAYDGDSSCIRTARLTVRAFLGRVGAEHLIRIPADTVSRAQLVVSELVTNAVRYADGACGLSLSYRGQGVDIVVWDESSQNVTVRDWDPARPGGFGLEIVRTLCGPLTVTPTAQGKQVHIRMPILLDA
ncbi:ATP-binding protein [Streptomyces fagopyri]